jgi:DNA modification methylase
MVSWIDKVHVGDCRELMRQMIADGVRVQCIVTSPPYFGLRDYGHTDQLGLETTLGEYVERMVEVFSLSRELLTDDGTLWLNLGDSYAASGRGGGGGSFQDKDIGTKISARNSKRAPVTGFKQKDLLGMPWRTAFGLQEDGWYLRQDIIWAKPNPMPESVTDRCTKAHEYVFLLSKSPKYFYDAEAISESSVHNEIGTNRGGSLCKGSVSEPTGRIASLNHHGDAWVSNGKRNRRSVWTIAIKPFSAAHFATFPQEIPRICILAGTRSGDTVLDPFMGSGTVAEVAASLGRHFIGCELNPAYASMYNINRSQQIGMKL